MGLWKCADVDMTSLHQGQEQLSSEGPVGPLARVLASSEVGRDRSSMAVHTDPENSDPSHAKNPKVIPYVRLRACGGSHA